MDFSPTEYDLSANDAEAPALHLIKLIDEHLKKENYNPHIILDMGCGPGNTAQILSEHFKSAMTIIGIDIDPEMIKYANEKRIRNCQFLVQDLEQPFSNWCNELRKFERKVDIIFSNYALHWIKNTDFLAQSIKNLLNNQSQSVFVANLLYPGWLQSVGQDEEETNLLNKLLNYPTQEEFINKFTESFQNAGFKWIDVKYEEPICQFDKKFYEEFFIKIPIKWYLGYLNQQTNLDQETGKKLNEIIKNLILKQRICMTIHPSAENGFKEQILLKQQLYIFRVAFRT